jgi:signal peptidase
MNPSTVRAQPFYIYIHRRKKKHYLAIAECIKDWYWLILIGGIAIVFYLVNYRWPRLPTTESNIHLAQPLMWCSLALMAYLGWRFDLRDRPPLNKRLVTIAALIGVSQVALYALAGLLYGTEPSPHGSPLLVVGNMLYVSSMLVGVEISRAYLLATFSKGSMIVALLVTSNIFWFLSIPVTKYASVIDMTSLLKIGGETFLPLGVEHLLASFLVLIGGPMTSIVYRGVVQTFVWLSPIPSDLPWMLTAFVGTMAPVFGMLLLRSHILVRPAKLNGSRAVDFRASTEGILVGMVAVTLLCFYMGVFGVQPTLVNGVSMEPTVMSGDVVITRDVTAESVEVGDIIRYRRDDIFILHRVVEIQKDDGEIRFITRGDANHTLDPPVKPSQLNGKVVLTVPKIGWVTMAVRQLIEWPP